MRTTIELDEDVRAELMRRSVARGDKGYSGIINELLRQSLGISDEVAERKRRVALMRAAYGTISDETAERMHAAVRETRERWRTDS